MVCRSMAVRSWTNVLVRLVEKFLIGRDGQVKGRWASTTKPESLKDAIMKELAAPAPNL